MKILQSLFNLLFNQHLIVNLFLGIIFIGLSLIFFEKIFKKHFSKKQKFIYIAINTICFSIVASFSNYIYANLLTLICSIILSIYLLKVSILQSFSYFCLKSIVFFNIQYLALKTIGVIWSNYSYSEITTAFIFGAVCIVLTLVIELIIYLCSKRINNDSLFKASINGNSSLLIFMSILNLITIFVISFRYFEKINNNLFYLLVLDLYFYFSILNVVHSYKISYAKQKIESLKICNKTILTIHDDMRAFKHDFHNIIQAMGGYIYTNDMKGLKKYYKEISKDCIHTNNLSKLNPAIINNPAIYNILANKYYIANNNNIQINLEIMLDLNELNIKIYEFTRILGILLDNAIEASRECNEKNINISFKQDKYKQMLIIENTYNDKQVSIDKIFEKDYTTKPHNTGLGLWEVRKILSKNSNLNLHTSKNNDYFSQQLEIYSA